MIRKLTITVAEDVYVGLHKVVGRRQISHFIENLVRPLVVKETLDGAYREMAGDTERESAALDLAEGATGDVGHAPW